MVTKTTFKKKFPDVKVQKLQTEVVFSRKHVEDAVLQMCGMMGLGLLYFSYSSLYFRENEKGTGFNETGN